MAFTPNGEWAVTGEALRTIRVWDVRTGNLLRKTRLEIAVNDDFVERTIKAIIRGAKTGETGDGKIFVMDMQECVRIRTEERGSVAIG